MALWRFVLLFALAVGSVLPHCAAATPVPASATHHAGMMHDQKQPRHDPSTAHGSDACIGCATPLRLSFAAPAKALAAATLYVAFRSTLTTRTTALDPPPPRQAA